VTTLPQRRARRPLHFSVARIAALIAVVLATGACDAELDSGLAETPQPGLATDDAATPSPSVSSSADAVATMDPQPFELRLDPVADGLDLPIWASSPSDGRTWVAEQGGRIVVIEDDTVRDDPVVDLGDRVLSGGERGLLAFAFSPEMPGRMLVHYSARPDGRTRIASLAVDIERGVADASSEQVLLEVAQPAANHNGGSILFGPDRNLWIALGDGGGARDQFDQAQRADTLLGAILRVTVDTDGAGYTIPADNPDPEGATGAPEVWAIGMRNPWRMAFDEGRLHIADVGQDQREEVDVIDVFAGSVGSRPANVARPNFGWPLREGTECFSGDCGRDLELIDPVVEFSHDDGCSIIGGMVYRGTAIPGLQGHYLYSDLCGGFLRSFRLAEDGVVAEEADWSDQVGPLGTPLSFGLDADGEVLLLSADGRVRRLVAAAGSAA